MTNISFVIPIFNEEKRLKDTFKALKELKLPHALKLEEIIFVDDGSTDKSRNLIQSFRYKNLAKYSIRLVSYPTNRGKGFAVRQGMLQSKSDYTLFFDADIATPLQEIEKFVPDMNRRVDAIIGTRKNGKSTVINHQPLWREILGRTFTKISCFILQISVTDFTCGFKAFSKACKISIFSQAKIDRWGYDAEILFLAKKLDLSIVEIPVVWSDKGHSKVNIYEAIPQTLGELFFIQWQHNSSTVFSILPDRKSFSFLKFEGQSNLK